MMLKDWNSKFLKEMSWIKSNNLKKIQISKLDLRWDKGELKEVKVKTYNSWCLEVRNW